MKKAKRFVLCCLGVPLLLACTESKPEDPYAWISGGGAHVYLNAIVTATNTYNTYDPHLGWGVDALTPKSSRGIRTTQTA